MAHIIHGARAGTPKRKQLPFYYKHKKISLYLNIIQFLGLIGMGYALFLH